jgi:predicted porin
LGNFSGTLLTGTATAVTAAGIRGAYDAKVKTANIGASWDFDVVKVVGELSKRKTEFEQPAAVPAVSDSADQKGILVGALVPVGAGQIKFSYSRVKTTLPNTVGVIGRIPYPIDTPDPTVSKLAIGYVHNLSKRTALYATVARVSNRNMAAQTISPANQAVTMFNGAPNAKATGYDFGVRHTF